MTGYSFCGSGGAASLFLLRSGVTVGVPMARPASSGSRYSKPPSITDIFVAVVASVDCVDCDCRSHVRSWLLALLPSHSSSSYSSSSSSSSSPSSSNPVGLYRSSSPQTTTYHLMLSPRCSWSRSFSSHPAFLLLAPNTFLPYSSLGPCMALLESCFMRDSYRNISSAIETEVSTRITWSAT